MRCLVVGTGSIGQRHCRNLAGLGEEVLAWDLDAERLRAVEERERVRPVASLEDGLDARPEAALICTPPASHVPLAHQVLSAGADLFVEKPISHSVDGVESLLVEARRRERWLMVGCNLRFLPSLRRAKSLLDEKRIGEVLAVRAEFGSYLPDWRPGRNYLENYAVHAALGGGVLLDAIHELDYLGWFFGPAAEVSCVTEHRSTLHGDTEDLAEVTVRFESKVLVQVHLDYLQRVYRRNLQAIGEGGTLRWDYPTHSVTLQSLDSEPIREDFTADEGDPNTMYIDEMRHFLECVRHRKPPLVDGGEALCALRLVEAAKTSSRERHWVRL